MAAARRALLSHLRVSVLARPAAAAGSVPAARLLSSATEEGSKGSFLDKGEVADRIVSVVKNFQKVEPSKVSTVADAHRTADSDLGVLGLCSVFFIRVAFLLLPGMERIFFFRKEILYMRKKLQSFGLGGSIGAEPETLGDRSRTRNKSCTLLED